MADFTGDYTDTANDETVGVSEVVNSLRDEATKMYEKIGIIACVLLTLLAAKKTPVFGQMTLTGSMALDWLKDGLKTSISRVEMGNVEAFTKDFNIPEWASGWCAIIFPTAEWQNPILVTQMSVLRWLENKCLEWEDAEVALAEGTMRNKKAVASLTFDGDHPEVTFTRDGKSKFAPYHPKLT